MTAEVLTGARRRGLDADVLLQRGRFRLAAALRATPGQVVAVLGPNGAGKTTLLRALAGLLPLAGGHIALDGGVLADSATHVPPAQRPVSVVFQDYRLFPHLNVRDNVAFPLRCARASRRDARHRAEAWLSRLGLHELADSRVTRISGGQAQRVALARALAAEPALLLLDEPTAALDAQTRAEVRAELRTHLARFCGVTVLVTHDPLEALLLADRVVVLEHGTVVQTGAPADIAARPATAYVAQLVGLNLFRGTRTGDAVVLDGGVTLRPRSLRAHAETGGPTPWLAAVRPSAIGISRIEPTIDDLETTWSGTVRNVDLLLDRARIAVDGMLPTVVDVLPARIAHERLDAGTPVWLSLDPDDAETYPDGEAQISTSRTTGAWSDGPLPLRASRST